MGGKRCNLMVVGIDGVGKSALTIQFVHNAFVQNYDPTIENTYQKQIKIDNDEYSLDILDSSCDEDLLFGMKDRWFIHAEGFLFVFSITSRSSFEKLEILRNRVMKVKDSTSIPIILVGNKSDLESNREVSSVEAKQRATEWKIQFFETSAKTAQNVDEIFFQCTLEVQKYYSKRLLVDAPPSPPEIGYVGGKSRRGCCLI